MRGYGEIVYATMDIARNLVWSIKYWLQNGRLHKVYIQCNVTATVVFTGWSKKVSHYHQLSLNRIKTRH